MSESPFTPPEADRQYHTYRTSHIPWYVRAMWIVFWIALIWYIVKFAIPSAKNYF